MFETPLREIYYSQDTQPLHIWTDKSQVLFVAAPLNESDVGSSVICFGSNGTVRWRFQPGRNVTDSGGDQMVPPYFTSSLQVLKGKTPSDNLVVVSSHHYLSRP